MPILSRKLDWGKEIDQTSAKNSFVICRPDEFPLSEIQAISERVLNPESSTPLFSRKPIPRCCPASNEILIHELKALAGVLYVKEAAIVGCLHLLTWEVARFYLSNRIKPDLKTADTDSIFTSRISVYLQCIVIAQKADSALVHEGEALAARQLLRILHHGKTKEFPSVVRLLTTITDTSCGELLPFDFLAEVLRRAEWREKLKGRLARLQTSQRWADAYSLVDGLRHFSQRDDLPPDVRKGLPDIFSHYPMWASWRPNLSRIQAWNAATTPEQRAQLAPVFELEGPDTTPQQRSTLRHSSTGAFPNARSHGTHNNKDILDELLDLLDRAVRIGPNAINLFIHLALVETSTAVSSTYELTWHPLHQLSAAFGPGVDSAPGVLLPFLQSLHVRPGNSNSNSNSPQVTIHNRMTIYTALLPLLTSSLALQTFFGEHKDVSIRAPRVLSEGQKRFCCCLLSHSQPALLLPLALAILSLGRALFGSTWLLGRWKPAFVQMLRAMPSEAEIRARFKAIQMTSVETRQGHVDYLAVYLGASEIKQGLTPPPPVVAVVSIEEEEDEAWRVELDADRHALRKTLKAMRSMHKLDLDLATRCLRAAIGTEEKQHDSFVRGVTGHMMVHVGGSSDQACVNMARFLAPRLTAPGGGGKNRKVKEKDCWAALCLWMMRRRPPGMLERLGAELSLESWNEWLTCLSKLFAADGSGPRARGQQQQQQHYLEEKGGLQGFAAERIRQITIWKMSRSEVGRMHSSGVSSSFKSTLGL